MTITKPNHDTGEQQTGQEQPPVKIYAITDLSPFHRYGTEHPNRVVEQLSTGYDINTEVRDGTLHIQHGEHINQQAVKSLLLDVHPDGSIEFTQRERNRPYLGDTFGRLPARERAIHGKYLNKNGWLETRVVGWDPIHEVEEDCWRVVCRLPWQDYVSVRLRNEKCLRRRRVKIVPDGDAEWQALNPDPEPRPFALRMMDWIVS